MMTRGQQALGTIGIVVALAGCATTNVTPIQETFATNLPPPGIVLVYKFAVNLNEVSANQGLFQKAYDAAESTNKTEQNEEIAQQVSDRLADELVKQITELGLPAHRADQNTSVPSNALVITGHFIDIDEGNQLRRLVIGLGAGQSKIDTQVQVLSPSGDGYRTLMEFKTHADSGEMPGAAVTMGAGAAAQGGVTAGMAVANAGIGGVKAYRTAIDAMAGRSADKAAQYLSEFFAREGWISPDKIKKPLL
ncbi:MAG: DUF4410 domain-containing protein [Deltaproteobacteria bacterium]|nr:DUF4410 domain-containing protein [Deltaproteobacteria bacterium]MBI3388391.1 DUF4410 domain-containing protein [Deltaproteobacteria bacterium]